MDLMTLLAKLTLDKTQYDQGLDEAEKDAKNLNIATPVIPKTDNSQFKEGLEEAEDTGNWFKEVMSGVWEGVKDAIVATGIMALVTGIIGQMKQGISLAINGGKEIADNSKNLGISTKAYQEYEYALKKSNLSMKDLSKSMTTLENVMGGKYTDKQAKWLENLGIDAENATSKGQLLEDVMTSLASYNGSDKGAIINWLFGSNENWDGYFDQTNAEIDALKQEAEKLGLVMSDESINNAVEFTEASERLSNTLEGIKLSFGESILPLLTDAIKKVEMIVSFFGGKDTSLSERYKESDKAFAKELLTIEGTSEAAETLADKLIAMGDTSKMTAEQYEIWKGTADALIDLVPTLGDVIDTETGKINANSEGIKENIKQWENLAKQKALQELKEEKYRMLVESNQQLIDKNVDLNVKEAEAAEKKAMAIEKANELMSKNSTISAKFQSAFGQDTITDWSQVQWLEMATQHYTGFGELNQYINDFIAANQEAVNAGEDVKTLTEQLEEGKRQYEAWLASAEELYGIPSSEADNATESVKRFGEELDKLPLDKTVHIHAIYDDGTEYRPHAIGSAYIPFDNYPALLHRGEKIMTATDARRDEQSGRLSTDFEDRVIAAIRMGMADAQVTAVVTDKQVAKGSNRYNGNEMDARRFNP